MPPEPSPSDRAFAPSGAIRGLNVLATASALAASTSVVATLLLDSPTAESWASGNPVVHAAVAGTFAFGVVGAISVRALAPLPAKLVSLGALMVAVVRTVIVSSRGFPIELPAVLVALVLTVVAWGPGALLVWFAFGRPIDAARKAASSPASLGASDTAERRVARVSLMYGAVALWLAIFQAIMLHGPVMRHALTFACAIVALATGALAMRLLARRSVFRRSFLSRVRAGRDRDYRLTRDARGRETLTRVQTGSAARGYRVADVADETIGIVEASETADAAADRAHSS